MTDPSPTQTPGTPGHEILHGIGVSAGTASGPAVQVRPAPGPDTSEAPTTDVEEAKARVRAVMEEVATGLTARAAHADEHARPILEATAMMARDPGLASGIDTQLATGLGITQSVHKAVEEYCTMFASLGGYMAERVTDLRDVGDRTICRLRGMPEPGVPELTEPSVLIAHDLAPAETATLTPEMVRGIVTSAGGPTSHTAILAAQLGIPAVVQVKGATALRLGCQLRRLDAGTQRTLQRYIDQTQKRRRLLNLD